MDFPLMTSFNASMNQENATKEKLKIWNFNLMVATKWRETIWDRSEEGLKRVEVVEMWKNSELLIDCTKIYTRHKLLNRCKIWTNSKIWLKTSNKKSERCWKRLAVGNSSQSNPVKWDRLIEIRMQILCKYRKQK